MTENTQAKRSWRETDYVMPRRQVWLWRTCFLLVVGLVLSALAELGEPRTHVPAVSPWKAAYESGYRAGWHYLPSYTPNLYSTPRANLFEYWCFRARKYGVWVANTGGSRAVGVSPQPGSMVPEFSKSVTLDRAWVKGCKVSATQVNRERNRL